MLISPLVQAKNDSWANKLFRRVFSYAMVLVIVIVIPHACIYIVFNRKVVIEVNNLTQGEDWIIGDLTAFYGPEKSHTGELRNGQSATIFINSDLPRPEALIVNWYMDDSKKGYSWEQLTILPHKKYLVQINIKKNHLEYRSCIKPCDINTVKYQSNELTPYE